MQITKLEHACLLLSIGSEQLLIDPGSYTRDLDELGPVSAVVITHVHDDHCSEEQLGRLLATNPKLQAFGTGEVCQRLAKSMPELVTHEVHHGDLYRVTNFELEFFGERHLEIHHSIPLVQNCGVMVNRTLYYPGDSYTLPDQKIEVLACPSSAPWLKLGDVLDFVIEAKASKVFPTHNALHSELGNRLYNSRIAAFVTKNGGEFIELAPGESLGLA
jgi:L-ascorbate metabolism protein UlaG (beta-lactamase superfamily)